MRVILKILSVIFILIVLVAASGYVYFASNFPKVDAAPALRVELTEERIERGAYLANHVSICIDCHSTRNWDYYSGPIVAGTEGMGGQEFEESMGTIRVANITPAAIGDWSDGDLAWAITVGVNPEGEPLAPIMPYGFYRYMAEDDLHAIIAYIRSLKPQANGVSKSSFSFPFNFIVRTIPQAPAPQTRPAASDTVAYGKYLTTIGGCASCHTPMEKGAPIEGMECAGGFEFNFPPGQVLRSANITPDSSTGIGQMSRENFIGLFKAFQPPGGARIPLGERENRNTLMPWTMYAGMTEEDLGAIYAYLRTLPPVENVVEKFGIAE